MQSERATLGGGCFWCLEAVFAPLQGVLGVLPGYAGGKRPHPSYQQVCTGSTGHAEVVQIDFNPQVISYRELLKVFFAIHDPTTLNRQGADRGTQYRSVIFYHSPEQKETADQVLSAVAKDWSDPVVTELVPLKAFYPAEAEHHQYFQRHPQQAYCQVVINPKVSKAKEHFAHLWGPEPETQSGPPGH